MSSQSHMPSLFISCNSDSDTRKNFPPLRQSHMLNVINVQCQLCVCVGSHLCAHVPVLEWAHLFARVKRGDDWNLMRWSQGLFQLAYDSICWKLTDWPHVMSAWHALFSKNNAGFSMCLKIRSKKRFPRFYLLTITEVGQSLHDAAQSISICYVYL